jgi:serine/threonine-protein kinase RsbW
MDGESTADRQIARINVAAARDYLGAVLAFLREAAGALGLPPPEMAGLARAVETVCRNVVERGFEPGAPASFDIALLRRPGHLVVVVEDRGLPFDFMSLEAEAGSGLPEASLRSLADAVHFHNLGARGNRVEILKRLPYPHIEAYIAAGQAAPVAPAPAAPSPGPVHLRLMTPDDAIAVARCTYAVYGYSLPDDYLYVPDRMREMLDGGLLEVCIGTTPAGEVVSCLTCQVDEPGAPVGYLGEGLVDPRFRHHGLLEQMLRFAQARARERGLLGIYAEAVTVHPYSQKSNLALGFSEMGVQLGDEAPTVDFKQIAGGGDRRRTATVLNFLKTREGPRRAVYPPARHRPMIERLYGSGSLSRELRGPAPAALPAAGGRVRVEVYPEWSEALLRVAAYGADLPDLVRARLRELCRRRIDWIGLDLPLSDPGAAHLCAAFEGLGFFFAGIIPDLVGDDILRLQYLNEVEVEVASAQIASDFGRELFGYVVRAMGEASGAPAP